MKKRELKAETARLREELADEKSVSEDLWRRLNEFRQKIFDLEKGGDRNGVQGLKWKVEMLERDNAELRRQNAELTRLKTETDAREEA